MTGNNSCGTRSIRYGIMRDNVLAIDAILADGSEARFGEVGHNLAPLAPTDSPPPGGEGLGVGVTTAPGGPHPDPSPQGEGIGWRAAMTAPRPFRDMLALGRREAEHIAHAFPEVSRRVGGYLIDALVPGDQARQPRHAAVRLGGHAGRLAPHRAEALAAAEEQGARHLPLRHLPQGHGGDPAHRQAGPGRRRGGRSHADRARPRHRHVPPGDGDLRARRARRAAAGRVRRGRPGREPAPPRTPRRADGRSRPPQQRGQGRRRRRPAGRVGGARLRPQHHDVDEERGKARLLHRGLRGAARAPRRLHRAPHRRLRQARHQGHLVRARLASAACTCAPSST